MRITMVEKKVYSIDKMEWQKVRPDVATLISGHKLFNGKLETANISINKVDKEGGFEVHRDQFHHIMYLIEGHAKLILDGETIDFQEGMVVQIPAGMDHGYTNIGEGILTILTMNLT